MTQVKKIFRRRQKNTKNNFDHFTNLENILTDKQANER